MQCIEEAKRVCKSDGKIFFAFISNDMVILTMQQCQEDYLMNGDYNKETFRLDDFPFVFHTPDHCRELLGKAGIQIIHEVASDGASELLQDLVNELNEASYATRSMDTPALLSSEIIRPNWRMGQTIMEL